MTELKYAMCECGHTHEAHDKRGSCSALLAASALGGGWVTGVCECVAFRMKPGMTKIIDQVKYDLFRRALEGYISYHGHQDAAVSLAESATNAAITKLKAMGVVEECRAKDTETSE